MIKLYKRIGNELHYHEAWVTDDAVIEHFGSCGDRGQTRKHELGPDLDEDEALESTLAAARAQGFEELEEDGLVVLLVEYPVNGMGSSDDVTKRHAVQDALNEALGWSGIGHVDGGSIGSGTMEVCCMVADAGIARRVIEARLKGTQFGDYTRIYEE